MTRRPLSAIDHLLSRQARPSMNILRIASAVTAGEIITLDTTVFEVKTTGQVVTTGRTPIDLTGSGTAAAATLTGTYASNMADADTVTIGSTVYTYKTALTASGVTANEVLIGVDLTASRDNLVAAVNKAAGGGTTYGSGTVINATVTASASSTNAIVATAKVKGTAGNAIALNEASSHFSWAGAATALAGGVDPTAAEAITAIIAAVNSVVSGFNAQAGGSNEIVLIGTNDNGLSLACTETLAGSNNAFAAATSFGGVSVGRSLYPALVLQRAATATEVALGAIRFPLNFAPTAVVVQVQTSAKVFKAFDGAWSITGNILTMDNSGSSDWAAGDLVTAVVSV